MNPPVDLVSRLLSYQWQCTCAGKYPDLQIKSQTLPVSEHNLLCCYRLFQESVIALSKL